MNKRQNPNLEILEFAVARLEELANEMVFLGGCATGLLVTDSAAPPIRVTKDVDAIVQVVSIADYYQLAKRLRDKGFTEDVSDDAPICRWIADNIVLDVMPTDESILGFGDQWYKAAANHAANVEMPSGRHIKMVSAPYFLITKLEAFYGRGDGDFILSHDMEDIVAVLDGRPTLVHEVIASDPVLIEELSTRFQTLLQEPRFIDAVSGHMPTNDASQARVS